MGKIVPNFWFFVEFKMAKGGWTCHWHTKRADLKYTLEWFNEKEKLIKKSYPELETSIEVGTKNSNFIRMFFNIDQENIVDDSLKIFLKTKEIMEYSV